MLNVDTMNGDSLAKIAVIVESVASIAMLVLPFFIF